MLIEISTYCKTAYESRSYENVIKDCIPISTIERLIYHWNVCSEISECLRIGLLWKVAFLMSIKLDAT